MEAERNRERNTRTTTAAAGNSNKSLYEQFPDGIIELIFSKLLLFNLPICRIVCKSWNNQISNLKFDPNSLFFVHITPHHREINRINPLHCIDFDPKYPGGMNTIAKFSFHSKCGDDSTHMNILNSCHGLLLCSLSITTNHRRTTQICILNPITNEYLHLCSHTMKSDTKNLMHHYAFGFCPNTKQFKIARHSKQVSDSMTLIEICAFDDPESHHSEWIRVGFVPIVVKSNVACFNGALYWVGIHIYNHVIFRLDLEDYRLEALALPPNGLPQDHRDELVTYFFGVLNDGAFYLTIYAKHIGDEFQLWKMVEEDFSWIKEFSFPQPVLSYNVHQHTKSKGLQLIKVCEDGKILSLLTGLDFLLFDPDTGTTQILTDQDGEIKKHLQVYAVDSFNFNSLSKILVGNS